MRLWSTLYSQDHSVKPAFRYVSRGVPAAALIVLLRERLRAAI